MGDNKINVLVTGGSGFIGYNLIKSSNNFRIKNISRHPKKHYLRGLVGEYITGDIRDYNIVDKAMEGVDLVFHLAGIPASNYDLYKDMLSVANKGTRNILKAAAIHGTKKIVVASSISCCGFSNNKYLLDENSNSPDNLRELNYIKSKHDIEDICGEEWPMDVVVARIARVYGSGDYYGNSSRIIKRLEKSITFVPLGGSSYIDVGDCVRALLLLAEKGEGGEKYIVSSENLSFMQIYSYFKEMTGSNTKLLKLPKPMRLFLPLAKKITPDYIYENIVYGFNNKPTSSKKIRNLGWKPIVPIKKAVRDCVDFYVKNH